MAGEVMVRPTIEEIRAWPVTVDVTRAATALGVSRATAYEAIKRGKFPVRTLKVSERIVVVTSSILAVLGEPGGNAA